MTAIGKDDRWHLEMKRRWVDQYNFYVQDSHWGRMFVRVCPYFPFSARVCLNQHYWLALRLQERGIRFRQCANAFLQCSDPKALQDRKSTRLNSSHRCISYAVFCLKKKKQHNNMRQ